jgi:dTDP-4-amino-4,6-dideoxygalactose transaminase
MVIHALERADIESRPAWKPMHLQPVFDRFEVAGGRVSAGVFDRGICLPSGSALTLLEVERIADVVRACANSDRATRPVSTHE